MLFTFGTIKQKKGATSRLPKVLTIHRNASVLVSILATIIVARKTPVTDSNSNP
jgi:hypothetical protein